jgi:PAS domain S-box-containing protein
MIALLGYRALEEIKGENILEFLVPEERPVIAAEIANCPRPVGEARRDYRIVRPDGTERRLQAGATQHVEFEGETSRLVVVRDVTEEYRLREQLALADRMASIGTVAAGVAHEINNPLAYVHMNLEVALRELGARDGAARDSTLGDCVRSAMEGTERVRGIVRNLKTLSRADEDDLEAVDLPALLDSTLAFASSALVLKAKVVRSYGAAPPALAAQGRLGQVFLNLLLNAADAIPEGAPARHEVRVSTAMDANGRAVVEIADTGTGIPRELAGRVFDPFFTTKASGAGTGLGLAICRGFIEAQGGRIEAQNRRDRSGAILTLRIPVPEAAEIREPVAAHG